MEGQSGLWSRSKRRRFVTKSLTVEGASAVVGGGRFMVFMERLREWVVGWVVVAAGCEACEVERDIVWCDDRT